MDVPPHKHDWVLILFAVLVALNGTLAILAFSGGRDAFFPCLLAVVYLVAFGFRFNGNHRS